MYVCTYACICTQQNSGQTEALLVLHVTQLGVRCNTNVLYCTVLYILYCTVLYCTVLYCTIQSDSLHANLILKRNQPGVCLSFTLFVKFQNLLHNTLCSLL